MSSQKRMIEITWVYERLKSNVVDYVTSKLKAINPRLGLSLLFIYRDFITTSSKKPIIAFLPMTSLNPLELQDSRA